MKRRHLRGRARRGGGTARREGSLRVAFSSACTPFHHNLTSFDRRALVIAGALGPGSALEVARRERSNLEQIWCLARGGRGGRGTIGVGVRERRNVRTSACKDKPTLLACSGRGAESVPPRFGRLEAAPKALAPSARRPESLLFSLPGSDVDRAPPPPALAGAPLFLEVKYVRENREIEIVVAVRTNTDVRQQRAKLGTATTHYRVQFGLDDFKRRRHRRFWVHQEIRSSDVYSAVTTTWPRSCRFLSNRNALGVWRRGKKQLRRSSEKLVKK